MRVALFFPFLAIPTLAAKNTITMEKLDEDPEATCTGEKPSEDEQKQLDTWLEAHQLNEYGYHKAVNSSAVRSGRCGTFESVLFLYSDRPWVPYKTSKVCSKYEQQQIEDWTKKNGLNPYGDPKGTLYLGGSALFNESTGEKITTCEKVRRKFPDALWLSQDVTLDVLQSEANEPGQRERGDAAKEFDMNV